MGRRHVRGPRRSARAHRHKHLSRRLQKPSPIFPQGKWAGRQALLLGTALASTLVLGSLLTPTTARADVTCPPSTFPPPGPIAIINPVDDISCINLYDRSNNPPTADAVIQLTTNNANEFIYAYNSGILTAVNTTGDAFGLVTGTTGASSPIRIENLGDITATADMSFSSPGLAQGLGAATSGANSAASIDNSGDITVNGFFAQGIRAFTMAPNSPLHIENTGGIAATGNQYAIGIGASTYAPGDAITVENQGGIVVRATSDFAGRAMGLYVHAENTAIPISVVNSGDITAIGNDEFVAGIRVEAPYGDSPVSIVNSGDLAASEGDNTFGIYAYTRLNSPISIVNSGDIASATSVGRAYGVLALGRSPISVANSGDIAVATSGPNPGYSAPNAIGIGGFTFTGDFAPVTILNRGNINAASDYASARAIAASTLTDYSPISIVNEGDLTAISRGLGLEAYAIAARSTGSNAPIQIFNSGDLIAVSTAASRTAYGIQARTDREYSDIFILNAGGIAASSPAGEAKGISARTGGLDSYTKVTNIGDITANGSVSTYGIWARSEGVGSDIVVENAGTIRATGGNNYGIHALTNAYYSDIVVQNFGRIEARGSGVGILIESNYANALVQNYGTVVGGDLGILVEGGGTEVGIINRGSITADSLFAIELIPGGGYGAIENFGLITGYIEVFGLNNEFVFGNRPGGRFEARLTSLFGGGGFFNFEGATVHTADDPRVPETTIFTGISLFDNKGLVSMVDGAPGDTFQLTGSTYDYYSVSFNGSGDSTLAIDAFLGGPGSTSDILIVDGGVTGKTALQVNNTNPGPGVNGAVIPVIEVGGNVKSDAFFLPQTIDTGFFNYDLFFRPTGSGIFELRSFPGGGALLLPQLVTGTHDIWHQGSSTWFDRTADLRVLLAGGAAPIAYNPNGGYAEGAAAGPSPFTPAVWARGSGAWLDREKSETVTAFGNSYNFKLDRDLEVIDWQMGLDLGKRDLFSSGDILVFGVLGGFVGANLDYDQIARQFDFSGGQVGGYATYLNGGLFVDTLLNAHLLELETRTLGFANSLDANTLGLRTDTGYRFGSFSGGAFIEPLATIAVLWSDIDGFTNGGNRVSFDDEANVRGRLGLRVGTSYPVWTGTTMEPFVIGSLWGNLSGDNQATLTSSGTTFRFEDDLDDIWGEVSAGVNFFNPSASTAVFAKLDVTFGDEVDGIGGKASMRVSW